MILIFFVFILYITGWGKRYNTFCKAAGYIENIRKTGGF